jgi:uncharacterized protein YraI
MTNSPAPARFPLPAILGIGALGLIGVGFLALAAFSLGRSVVPAPVASQTRTIARVALIPTTTQSPPTATFEPTTAPTLAPLASPTPSPTMTATAAVVVSIIQAANVRTGPGLTYPVVGGLNTGQTAPALGRDSSAQWFNISFDGAPQGQGWVSVLVATINGSINDLPVIQAAAPPPPTSVPPTNVPPTNVPPTNAPPAATNTPTTAGANGIQTLKFVMEKTTGAVNESMWFDFSVVNTTGSAITYGILAAHTDQGTTADSWHDPLLPGKQVDWRDHINFGTAGTYQVYLGICYSNHDDCKGSAPWTRLSNLVAVTIQ